MTDISPFPTLSFTHFTSTDEQVYWHLSDGDDPLNFSPLNHAKPILRNNLGSKVSRRCREVQWCHDVLTIETGCSSTGRS